MVRYRIELDKAGMPGLDFAKGFQGDNATILVGPDKALFEVPIAHLAIVDFFAKAFNGKFKERVTEKIELSDETERVFALFLRWLYSGISGSDLVATPTCTKDLVGLLLAADKWCIPNLAINSAKKIYNAAHDLMKHDAEGNPENDWTAVGNCLKMTASTPFRYIFVHAVWGEGQRVWPQVLETQMDNEYPEYFKYAHKWSTIVYSAIKTAKDPWVYNKTDLDESNAHNADKFLLPLLFESESFPDIFQDLEQVCTVVDERRAT